MTPRTDSPFHRRATGWDSNVIQHGYDGANRMTSATLDWRLIVRNCLAGADSEATQ